jgi:hypothetical protein
MAPRPGYYPECSSEDALDQDNVDASVRLHGYPEDAELPSAEFNALHNEIDAWVKYLDGDLGVYASATILAGNVSLTGATGTVAIGIARQCVQRNRVTLELVISIAGITGTLTNVTVDLPAGIQPASGYYGSARPIFTVHNRVPAGDVLACWGWFADSDSFVISRLSSSLGVPVPFLVDTPNNASFSMVIDYERVT